MSLTNPGRVVTVERLAYFWSQVKNGLGIGQQKTATLSASNWNSTTHTQTVTVTGVTTANTVIVTPHPDSIAAWVASGVRCTGQAANSLTFTCADNPTAEITANILTF